MQEGYQDPNQNHYGQYEQYNGDYSNNYHQGGEEYYQNYTQNEHHGHYQDGNGYSNNNYYQGHEEAGNYEGNQERPYYEETNYKEHNAYPDQYAGENYSGYYNQEGKYQNDPHYHYKEAEGYDYNYNQEVQHPPKQLNDEQYGEHYEDPNYQPYHHQQHQPVETYDEQYYDKSSNKDYYYNNDQTQDLHHSFSQHHLSNNGESNVKRNLNTSGYDYNTGGMIEDHHYSYNENYKNSQMEIGYNAGGSAAFHHSVNQGSIYAHSTGYEAAVNKDMPENPENYVQNQPTQHEYSKAYDMDPEARGAARIIYPPVSFLNYSEKAYKTDHDLTDPNRPPTPREDIINPDPVEYYRFDLDLKGMMEIQNFKLSENFDNRIDENGHIIELKIEESSLEGGEEDEEEKQKENINKILEQFKNRNYKLFDQVSEEEMKIRSFHDSHNSIFCGKNEKIKTTSEKYRRKNMKKEKEEDIGVIGEPIKLDIFQNNDVDNQSTHTAYSDLSQTISKLDQTIEEIKAEKKIEIENKDQNSKSNEEGNEVNENKEDEKKEEEKSENKKEGEVKTNSQNPEVTLENIEKIGGIKNTEKDQNLEEIPEKKGPQKEEIQQSNPNEQKLPMQNNQNQEMTVNNQNYENQQLANNNNNEYPQQDQYHNHPHQMAQNQNGYMMYQQDQMYNQHQQQYNYDGNQQHEGGMNDFKNDQYIGNLDQNQQAMTPADKKDLLEMYPYMENQPDQVIESFWKNIKQLSEQLGVEGSLDPKDIKMLEERDKIKFDESRTSEMIKQEMRRKRKRNKKKKVKRKETNDFNMIDNISEFSRGTNLELRLRSVIDNNRSRSASISSIQKSEPDLVFAKNKNFEVRSEENSKKGSRHQSPLNRTMQSSKKMGPMKPNEEEIFKHLNNNEPIKTFNPFTYDKTETDQTEKKPDMIINEYNNQGYYEKNTEYGYLAGNTNLDNNNPYPGYYYQNEYSNNGGYYRGPPLPHNAYNQYDQKESQPYPPQDYYHYDQYQYPGQNQGYPYHPHSNYPPVYAQNQPYPPEEQLTDPSPQYEQKNIQNNNLENFPGQNNNPLQENETESLTLLEQCKHKKLTGKLQRKLRDMTDNERLEIFKEIKSHFLEICCDPYGKYVATLLLTFSKVIN